jgi:hypothetical protein
MFGLRVFGHCWLACFMLPSLMYSAALGFSVYLFVF